MNHNPRHLLRDLAQEIVALREILDQEDVRAEARRKTEGA